MHSKRFPHCLTELQIPYLYTVGCIVHRCVQVSKHRELVGVFLYVSVCDVGRLMPPPMPPKLKTNFIYNFWAKLFKIHIEI